MEEAGQAEHPGETGQGPNHAEERQRPYAHAEAAALEQRRGFAPGGERSGIDAGFGGFADHGEVLAEIEAGAQFLDRQLADAHGLGRGGRQQPAGECLLADVGAGAAEKLEEGALAKKVEVFGVGMCGVEVALAGLAGSRPVAVQAG